MPKRDSIDDLISFCYSLEEFARSHYLAQFDSKAAKAAMRQAQALTAIAYNIADADEAFQEFSKAQVELSKHLSKL